MSGTSKASATAPGPAVSAPTVEVKHRGLITLSIMLATIMQVLDTTIANVALPSMTAIWGRLRTRSPGF